MKKIVRRILNYLPKFVSKSADSLHFSLTRPKQLSAKNDYRYSDERLKFLHLLECMNYIRVSRSAGLPQVFFEFGCHSGRTFSAAINAAMYLNMSDAQFYAFDSFEGLPTTKTEEDGIFDTGSFCTSELDFLKIVKQNTGKKLEADHLIKGFYCDSLTEDLKTRMPKVGVAHIDVDLYSSTVDVLNFLKPLLMQGSVLVFDDWYCFPGGSLMGERRALTEFLDGNTDFSVEPWKAYSTFGQSFFVSQTPNN
jgi:O-methyltransferase